MGDVPEDLVFRRRTPGAHELVQASVDGRGRVGIGGVGTNHQCRDLEADVDVAFVDDVRVVHDQLDAVHRVGHRASESLIELVVAVDSDLDEIERGACDSTLVGLARGGARVDGRVGSLGAAVPFGGRLIGPIHHVGVGWNIEFEIAGGLDREIRTDGAMHHEADAGVEKTCGAGIPVQAECDTSVGPGIFDGGIHQDTVTVVHEESESLASDRMPLELDRDRLSLEFEFEVERLGKVRGEIELYEFVRLDSAVVDVDRRQRLRYRRSVHSDFDVTRPVGLLGGLRCGGRGQ